MKRASRRLKAIVAVRSAVVCLLAAAVWLSMLPSAFAPTAVASEAGDAAVFRPDQSRLPVAAPAGAVVLLGPDADPSGFTSMSGEQVDWRRVDGAIEVTTTPRHANHIVSREVFGDADLHAEFMVHPTAHGNSGLYLHGLYEMQIYDSFGTEPPTEQDAGSLYRFAAPLVNAARRPGEWQVYDIRFIAPRRDPKGAIVKAGSITAWLNGSRVQDGVTFTEPRSPYTPYRHGVTDYLREIERRLMATGKGPLFLQDHGSPTRFRNIWFLPLKAVETGAQATSRDSSADQPQARSVR